ncbi:hypothetical protein JCM17844_21950 [Iodidimonas gelatinilytica]|uniref:Lyase n=1 Tax=Iodidimonas gelatinilytica TaxID=1236966 RepID=A0A5A7MU45_9PROT|nr:hypothetical protein JCM17844_21950 [Iodidimonas gelatinilytica]
MLVRPLLVLIAGVFMSVGFAPLSAASEEKNPVTIKEWTVPYEESRPRDPFAVSEKEVWFVGQRSSYLARLNPQDGSFEKHDLVDQAGPHNLIVGKDGIVWYAGNLKGYVGRFDPENGEIEKIAMPDPAARDPHTLVFDADQSHIWFTVQGGNFIGRVTVADRKVDLIPVPTPRARPYGIRMAPDGTPWIVLFGTHKLASVNPESLELTEYEIPHEDARPRRLEITSGGDIYYADYVRGTVGLYDPETRMVTEWPLPSGEKARPYGTAIDTDDVVWIAETGVLPNQLVGFDTKSAEFVSVTAIPSGARSVRHMDYHAPSDTLWFGTDANTIGRAELGQ